MKINLPLFTDAVLDFYWVDTTSPNVTSGR